MCLSGLVLIFFPSVCPPVPAPVVVQAQALDVRWQAAGLSARPTKGAPATGPVTGPRETTVTRRPVRPVRPSRPLESAKAVAVESAPVLRVEIEAEAEVLPPPPPPLPPPPSPPSPPTTKPTTEPTTKPTVQPQKAPEAKAPVARRPVAKAPAAATARPRSRTPDSERPSQASWDLLVERLARYGAHPVTDESGAAVLTVDRELVLRGGREGLDAIASWGAEVLPGDTAGVFIVRSDGRIVARYLLAEEEPPNTPAPSVPRELARTGPADAVGSAGPAGLAFAGLGLIGLGGFLVVLPGRPGARPRRWSADIR